METLVLDTIQKCLSGDVNSFRTIVDSYRERLIRIGYRYLHDWDEAVDLSQETFIRAYQSLATYDPTKKFDSWLIRIMVNLCIDRIRHRSLFEKHLFRYEDTIHAPSKTPDDALESARQIDLLQKAIGQLNDRQQSAFILRELEGLSFEAIADILKCTQTTVRVHLFTAKKKLQKLLKESGL